MSYILIVPVIHGYKLKWWKKISAYFGEHIRHNGDGDYTVKANKWSENGAERAENWVSGNEAVSGGYRKRWSVSGAWGGGAGTERRAGDPGMPWAFSAFLPLMLPSHALEVRQHSAKTSHKDLKSSELSCEAFMTSKSKTSCSCCTSLWRKTFYSSMCSM
jgi:hypothetical protein